jgi:hypothetical protein
MNFFFYNVVIGNNDRVIVSGVTVIKEFSRICKNDFIKNNPILWGDLQINALIGITEFINKLKVFQLSNILFESNFSISEKIDMVLANISLIDEKYRVIIEVCLYDANPNNKNFENFVLIT